MRRVTIGVVVALVLFVLFVVLCTFVKRPYEKVLLTRFGTPVPEERQVRLMYNWYFKLPTDGVIRVDTRLHLHPGTLQEVVTKGKETISVQTFAVWKITDPLKFYKSINADDKKAEDSLETRIRGLVTAELSSHTLDELFNPDDKKIKTEEIENRVAKLATVGTTTADGKTIPGMNDLGIEVDEVGFARIAFPPNTAQAVYLRMVKELTKQAADYQARGEAEATRIKAEGDAKASAIRESALAEAQKTRGEADAAALQLIGDMLKTPADREFYEYWKSLDFLKTSLTKNTIFVISSTSSWLKSIMRDPDAKATPAPGAASGGARPANDAVDATGLIPAPTGSFQRN